MPYFAYNVGGWVQKEGKMCLRNKSMAPNDSSNQKITLPNQNFFLDNPLQSF